MHLDISDGLGLYFFFSNQNMKDLVYKAVCHLCHLGFKG